MDKFAKCHLGLAGTLLLGIAVIAVAGVKKSGLAAVLAFLVMGLLGAVLAAQYKMEIYRVIGEQSPGAYERIVREGEYSHRVESQGRDEMAQLADEFNQLTDRLQTTEEARRRFVSDASHELKTPLASIRLLTDSILQNDSVDMSTVREFVADIGEEAERLTRISEHLLALTRLDAGAGRAPEPVELGRVADKVAHLLTPVAQRANVELKCSLEPACALLATEDDIYQVAFNLMENAIKYNMPGGRVDVAVQRWEDKVALIVTDTGLGIPREDLPKIFDRFYRVDKARSRAAGGTGLGLSIARDTARLHGGDITAGPNPAGRGTRFEAEFPALREEGAV